MKNSLYIGSPFGIKVTIHWTFLILIAIVVFIDVKNGSSINEILISVLFVLTIFGCVILHELGHSLAARKYGITTRGITLLPIGGLASLTKIPEEPQRELFVAIAGPLVNVAIATVISIILFITGFNFSHLSIRYLNLYEFLPALLVINVTLVIFNLIPAFPMDGGRLLRAGLAFKFNRVKATNIAAKIGQLIAIGFAFWGLFYNPLLIVIAAFVFIGARAELQDVRSKYFLEGKTIGDLVMKNYTLLNPEMKLDKVIEILMNGQEEEFIVMNGSMVAGVVTKNQILKGLSDYDKNASLFKIMDIDYFAVDINDKVKDIFEKFQTSTQKIAPVFENGEVVGIINFENMNKYIQVSEALKSR